jgi:hypothetical protein
MSTMAHGPDRNREAGELRDKLSTGRCVLDRSLRRATPSRLG